MTRLFKPVVLYPGTTSRPDEHTRDFRPKNVIKEEEPVITQPTPPETEDIEGEGGGDPKASSAPGSASTSGSETSDDSTPSEETQSPAGQSEDSAKSADVAKVRRLHPSAQTGKNVPPASASPSAPSSTE